MTMLKWFTQELDKPRQQRFILCPFHDEKTPSMVIDLFRGRFHCYGCGKTGPVSELPDEDAQ